jgi:hypothetical protein
MNKIYQYKYLKYKIKYFSLKGGYTDEELVKKMGEGMEYEEGS